MEQKINYIKAHKAIQLLSKNDIELRPIHKSILDALFMFWNKKDWAELFNIDRNDLMEYSRISSRKTYYETLSFLQEKEYIVYKPSKNPDIASVFGMGKKVTSAITSDGSCDITSANTSDTTSSSTIYINIKTLKPKTLKLINENATLLEECLEDWIKEYNKQNKVDVDFDKLKTLWNTSFYKTKVPKVDTITERRKKAVNAVLKIYGKEKIRDAILKIKDSKFLLGEQGNDWKINFDWLFIVGNFTKVIEGNYDKTTPDTSKSIFG